MALQSFTVSIGALRDANNNDKNYVSGEAIYVKTIGGSFASIFRDLAGTSEIAQDGLANQTDDNGQFTFFVEAGDYILEYQNQSTHVTVVGSDYFNSRIEESVNQIIIETSSSRGFRVVGDFASGFTYELANDVAIDVSGNYWVYADINALPVTVSAGTTPSEPTYTQVTFNQASGLTTTAGINAQQFIDNFELKIFQSPTDNLTKVTTFAGGVGVVYEVRKTSDNSLATIYSDKDGATEIVQNGTANISNSNSEAVFYIYSGSYYVIVDGLIAQFDVDPRYIRYFKSESEAASFGFTINDSEERIRVQDLHTYTDYEVVTVNNFGDDIDLGSGVYARRIKSYEEIMKEKGAKFLNYTAASGSGNQGQPIYIIGDSISEGTDSSNFAEFSYAALLRKSINKAFNNRNYGFANFNFRVPQAVTQPHLVTRSGFMASDNGEGDSFNSDYFGGIMIESDAAGQWVEFTYTGKDFMVVYGENAAGGAVDVTLDGAPFSSIDTSLVPAQRYTGSSTNGRFSEPLTPAKWGLHTVRLTTTSAAPVRLCGVVYCESFSNKINSPTVFNVGRSSIALSNVPDSLLEAYCNGGTIILSMGVNDDLLGLPIETFRSKLEVVLSKIESLDGSAIVNDFIFNKNTTNVYKFALREIASKYGFKYFDFYELWFGNSASNTFSNLLDTDEVHPTDYGHLNIAKNICEHINIPLETSVKPKKELKSLAAGIINLPGYERVSIFADGDITYMSGVAKNDTGAVIPQNTRLVNIGSPTPSDPQIIPIRTLSGMQWVEVRSDGWIYTGFGTSIAVDDWFSLNISFINTAT